MKTLKLLFLLMLSFSLIACSSDEKEVKKDETESVEVDKGIINVEVTIPASLFEGEEVNVDEIIAEAKKDGIKDVTKNEDGSLTYKMSKSQHKEIITEMAAEIEKSIKELESGEDFSSIEKIDHNKSFNEFTMTVNQSQYENSMDGIASFTLALQSMYYQLFNGVDEDEYKVTIQLQDKATGKVFDTIVYPDALEALEGEQQEQ